MLRSKALRFWATVLLATTLGGVAMPLFGDLHAGLDLACTDGAWTDAGHHTTTQIESVRPSVADDHCAVCHLQRALSGAADDAKRYVSTARVARSHVLASIDETRDTAIPGLPSRAPPVSRL